MAEGEIQMNIKPHPGRSQRAAIVPHDGGSPLSGKPVPSYRVRRFFSRAGRSVVEQLTVNQSSQTPCGSIPTRPIFRANAAGRWVVAMLSLAACSHRAETGAQTRHDTGATPSWRLIMQSCETQPDGSARCEIDRLKAAMFVAIDEHAELENCELALDECGRIAQIDCALAASRLDECRADRDSAWRSPWIWGAVGAALGFGLGVAAVR